MSKALVIVESPAKAKTINKYLGKDYEVEASLGHVKDLPKSKIGVDIENNFEAEYIVIPGKEKVLTNLKKKAKTASAIYLAPDPDREGEAIAAHLYEELGEAKPKRKRGGGIPIHRVSFNEITSKAVKAAFEHPRDIDWNLVDAQQTDVADRHLGLAVRTQVPDLAALMGQGSTGTLGWSGADRCSAAHRRTRTRDQSLREEGILDDRCAPFGCEAPSIRCAVYRN